MIAALRDKHLGFVFGVALLLRALCLIFAGANPQAAITMDSGSYITPAINLIEHRRFARGEWPNVQVETERTPGYSVFLIPFLKNGRLNIGAVQWTQAFLGALTAILVYALVLYLTNNSRAATLAGLGLAVDSVVICYTPFVLTETVFLFGWTLSFLLLIRGVFNNDGAARNLFEAGVLLGLTSLIRPVSLYYFIFVFPFLLFALRRFAPLRWKSNAALFFIASLLIPAAWTVRNGER